MPYFEVILCGLSGKIPFRSTAWLNPPTSSSASGVWYTNNWVYFIYFYLIPGDTKPLSIIIITSNNEQSESQTEHTFTLTSVNGTFDRYSNYYKHQVQTAWDMTMLSPQTRQHVTTLQNSLPLRLQKMKQQWMHQQELLLAQLLRTNPEVFNFHHKALGTESHRSHACIMFLTQDKPTCTLCQCQLHSYIAK